MQRLQSYPGKALSLMCLSNKGHGVQRVYYIVHNTERVRKSARHPWKTVDNSKYVLGCACQRKAGV
jgi:hypothetical protein